MAMLRRRPSRGPLRSRVPGHSPPVGRCGYHHNFPIGEVHVPEFGLSDRDMYKNAEILDAMLPVARDALARGDFSAFRYEIDELLDLFRINLDPTQLVHGLRGRFRNAWMSLGPLDQLGQCLRVQAFRRLRPCVDAQEPPASVPERSLPVRRSGISCSASRKSSTCRRVRRVMSMSPCSSQKRSTA
jgi:hypothetical protein